MAGRCQLDLALGAREQDDLQFELERLDALAERRLRHVETRGGSPEMQLLGHHQEIADVAQIDLHQPRAALRSVGGASSVADHGVTMPPSGRVVTKWQALRPTYWVASPIGFSAGSVWAQISTA